LIAADKIGTTQFIYHIEQLTAKYFRSTVSSSVRKGYLLIISISQLSPSILINDKSTHLMVDDWKIADVSV